MGLARTSRGGLTQAEADARLQAHGPNRLPEPPQRSAWLRFLLHFHNILIYVLLASAVVTAALGHVVDTLVILAVVLGNAVIGFVQEGRQKRPWRRSATCWHRARRCCAMAIAARSMVRRWCLATWCCWRRVTRCLLT